MFWSVCTYNTTFVAHFLPVVKQIHNNNFRYHTHHWSRDISSQWSLNALLSCSLLEIGYHISGWMGRCCIHAYPCKMDEQSKNEGSITHNKRAFKGPFVFLKQQIAVVPTRKHYETLEKDDRVKEITFTKGHSAKEMGRLLLASFPELLGIKLSQ